MMPSKKDNQSSSITLFAFLSLTSFLFKCKLHIYYTCFFIKKESKKKLGNPQMIVQFLRFRLLFFFPVPDFPISINILMGKLFDFFDKALGYRIIVRFFLVFVTNHSFIRDGIEVGKHLDVLM